MKACEKGAKGEKTAEKGVKGEKAGEKVEKMISW